jgi:hypothetical protein
LLVLFEAVLKIRQLKKAYALKAYLPCLPPAFLACLLCFVPIYIESLQNRFLKVCYVPTTNASFPRLLFAAAINNTNEANKAGSVHH